MLITLKEIKKQRNGENIVPVAISFPADTLTPVAACLRLMKNKHQAFFLESVEGGEHIGRFCFLGIDPFETITLKDGILRFEKHSKKDFFVIKTHMPFTYIQEYLEQYKALRYPGLPPFCGGAIGYVGFDCVRYIEDLPDPKQGAMSEFHDANLMLFQDVIAFDRVANKVIVISNMILDGKESIDVLYQKACIRAKNLGHQLMKPSKDESKIHDALSDVDLNQELGKLKLKASSSKAEYMENVRKTKKYIKQGDIFQGVISSQFETSIKKPPFEIYRSLRSLSPTPYLFYLSFSKDTKLMGASPEMLVRVSADGEMETCPIAGTRPRGKTLEEDLKLEKEMLASVKEKAEHLMLVDLGRNDLGRVAKAGSVHVPQFMKVERFSNVMHLVSRVQAKLKKGKKALDAFCSCFPAGTLSGAPKIRALEIIHELEPVPRGPYGGAVIYYDFSGALDSCIAIRSLFIHKNKAYFQAGAGIVADSRPEFEYKEILHKSSSIAKSIALAHYEAKQKA